MQQNSPTSTTGCPDFCKALAHAESTHTHKKSLKASNCLKRLKTRQKRKICAVCQLLAKQPDFHGEQRPPGGRGELLAVRPAGTLPHRARGAPGGDPFVGPGPGTGSCCHLLAATPLPDPSAPDGLWQPWRSCWASGKGLHGLRERDVGWAKGGTGVVVAPWRWCDDLGFLLGLCAGSEQQGVFWSSYLPLLMTVSFGACRWGPFLRNLT